MSIQKECVLRYRVDGHIRFQIPVQICSLEAAKAITEGISKIEGVYRVNLYRGQQKLSIRFDEAVCDFTSLARELFQLLATLEESGALKPKPASNLLPWQEKAKTKLGDLKATRWVKEKFGDAKETVQAAKVITKLGMKKPTAFMQDPEKAVIDFLNDILVIFLIRLHWDNITQHWLLKPLKHRYEWMALFYMFFLLVRSRRKK
ncbi:MAG: hypothetical protein ACNA7G_12910 [Methylobacter sp.]